MIGILDSPYTAYLVCCDVYDGSIDAHYIFELTERVLITMEINENDFYLLLTDSAAYMLSYGRILKMKYKNLFDVGCIAHLYHNVVSKLSSHFDNVNNLISSVKFAIVKSKARQKIFFNLKLPPDVICVRWGSWLKAAKYYSENFIEVKKIVNVFKNDGSIVEKAKLAVNNTDVKAELLNLELNYFFLLDLIEKSSLETYSIENALEDIKNIKIKDDVCDIESYITQRINKSDNIKIKNMENEEISPAIYAKLFNSQSTSVMVERSFSFLKKMNAQDRNFLSGNISKYLILRSNFKDNFN
jgi:hypothetical protein